jgi:UDP-glucose 4-epimerase
MNFKDTTIFLNGGAGFMGSHLIEKLSQDNKLIIYDNFSAAIVDKQWIKKFPNTSVIEGDIRDEEKITEAMNGSHTVLNLAAAHIRISLTNPKEVHEVNTTGILTSLKAAKKVGVKRFIYVSSSEIYGSATEKLLQEESPKDPTTVYGVSTQYFHRHENLSTMIIRLFNTYGPRAHFEEFYGEVIPRMCVRALAGQAPLIFGNGEQTRDFTYITDTIHGLLLASQDDRLVGDVVNIAYGEEVSIKRVVTAICRATKLSEKPKFLDARPNDVLRHAANTRKAKKLLGWNPQVSIEDGITMYVDWLKNIYKNPTQLLNKIPEKNW